MQNISCELYFVLSYHRLFWFCLHYMPNSDWLLDAPTACWLGVSNGSCSLQGLHLVTYCCENLSPVARLQNPASPLPLVWKEVFSNQKGPVLLLLSMPTRQIQVLCWAMIKGNRNSRGVFSSSNCTNVSAAHCTMKITWRAKLCCSFTLCLQQCKTRFPASCTRTIFQHVLGDTMVRISNMFLILK